jgi:hypothetical protein
VTRSYGAKWCNQRMQVFNVFDPSFERDANPEGFRSLAQAATGAPELPFTDPSSDGEFPRSSRSP